MINKHCITFDTEAEYLAFKASSGYSTPNVSYAVDNNVVHFNPIIYVGGVRLNKDKLTLTTGNSETLVATVLPSNAPNKEVTWSSSDANKFTVTQNGLVTAVADGNATITVTTVDGGYTAQCQASTLDDQGHDYVEIGGVRWATMNIGSTGVTDYGLYFQWGDTAGYTSGQCGSSGTTYAKPFHYADYKFNGGRTAWNESGITKYNTSDSKILLEACDDAATLWWGGDWRMPTTDEFQVLSTATTSAWTTSYNSSGVPGLVLTDNSDSSKKLFFPAAGNCGNGSFYDGGSGGHYWSSSLDTSNVGYAYYMYFNSSNVLWQYGSRRCFGFSVRPVLDI